MDVADVSIKKPTTVQPRLQERRLVPSRHISTSSSNVRETSSQRILVNEPQHSNENATRSPHPNIMGVIKVTFSLLLIGVIFWTFCSGIWRSSQRSIVPDPWATHCGLDQISGFYGPGSWGAWMLLFTSCIAELLFKPGRKPNHGTVSIFAGFDVNVLGLLAYPIIAAVDMLLHLKYAIEGPENIATIGTVAATSVITLQGFTTGLLLSILFFQSWSAGRSGALVLVYSIASTIILLIANGIYDALSRNPPPSSYIFAIFPGQAEPPDVGSLIRLIDYCELHKNVAPYGWVAAMLLFSQDWTTFYLSLLIACLAFVGFREQRGILRHLPIILDNSVRIIGLFFSAKFFVSMCFGVGALFTVSLDSLALVPYFESTPLTMNSIMDLDQLCTLIIGGCFVVLYTFAGLFKEYKKDIIAAGKVAMEWVRGFGTSFGPYRHHS